MKNYKKPKYWEKACKELSLKDPILEKIIKKNYKIVLFSRNDPFTTLIRSIIGQQVSVTVADKAWNNLKRKIKTKKNNDLEIVSPSDILLSQMQLSSIGLSKKKYNYIIELASIFSSNPGYCQNFSNLSDSEIIRILIQHKGIGPWTAKMFLLFYLMRPNVFPESDIGLIKSISKIYKLDQNFCIKKQVEKLSKNWEPWKTVATWYLWCEIDPSPIVY